MIKPIGLYVHIPFCVRKCSYCDFCSQPFDTDAMHKYAKRLHAELDTYRRDERISVDTLYIGGGTPSILPPEVIGDILTAVREVFLVCDGAEITIEVNPGTLTRDRAMLYRSLGINRVSVGLQSIHDNELKILGRIHNYEEFLASYRLLREVGFDNIGVDLMYGIPEQTMESFEATLDAVTALSPEHISAYGLIIEKETPFYDIQSTLNLPDYDTESDMYYRACDILRERGYNHYEISNYSRQGCESRHNLKYWRDEEYIGIGAAAYSYFEGVRYGNTRSLYEIECADKELLTLSDIAYEYAMMRFRLREGISLSEYRERFGVDFFEGREQAIKLYLEHGIMRLDGDRLSLTECGFYLSNSILVNIL